MKKFLIVSGSIVLLAVILAVCLFISNPHNHKYLGEIRPPMGYKRVDANSNSFTAYMRQLPLKKCGSPVHLHTGGLASFQFLSAAVVDVPTLSNAEQCADVCMRLRAEYLFSQGRYSEIKFLTAGGKWLTYTGGNSRNAFERFIRQVFDVCNTASLAKQLPQRRLGDMQPGDVFVYPARKGYKYGHAVMVADVAVNLRTGKKAFLLVEGNTPARDIHVIRNLNPLRNPWFILDEDDDTLYLNIFHFNSNELRHF